MALKLRCRLCGGEHKADVKHFPQSLWERQRQEVAPGKFELMPVLVGHACKKCVDKRGKVSFMREHGITIDKSGRKTIMQQIQDKIKELSLSAKKKEAADVK
jgi:hypothetical protein